MAELLVRKRQLAIVVENNTQEGTYNSALDVDSGAATVADFVLGSPQWAPNSPQFDREIVTPSLTPVAQFAPGVTSVELTFTTELSGHRGNVSGPAAYTLPAIFRLLEFCNWNARPGTVVPIASYDTGTVGKHFENWSKTAPSVSWNAIGGIFSGLDTDVVIDSDSTLGTPVTGDQMTAGETGTVITLGTVPGGVALRQTCAPISLSDPASADVKTASAIYYVDGKRVKIKGMRGTPEFVFEHGKPPRVNFRFLGVLEDYVDGALLSGADKPQISQTDPTGYLGVGLKISNGTDPVETSLIHNSLTLSGNNNLALRENSGDVDGWSFATVSSRQFSGSINFDEVIDATHDLYADAEAGIPHHMRFTLNGGTGNTFEFRLDGVQYTSMTEGNRDEVTVWDAQFDLRGRSFAIQGDNSTATGEDDEIVIINT